MKGLPQLHFLRQEYKDPTNQADGTWRFIYVNAAGSIIGSTKYATLQQMQILDMNGGVMPTIPGQPEFPPRRSQRVHKRAASMPQGRAAALRVLRIPSRRPANRDRRPTRTARIRATGPRMNLAGRIQPARRATTAAQIPTIRRIQLRIPPKTQRRIPRRIPRRIRGRARRVRLAAAPVPSAADKVRLARIRARIRKVEVFPRIAPGVNLPGGLAGLAALAELKPTGPVDGPVLGGFLTGVGSKTDAASVKRYNGAKKLNQFEFIWNPLEDAAAALQNQISNMQSNGLGLNSTSPNGTRAQPADRLDSIPGSVPPLEYFRSATDEPAIAVSYANPPQQ